VLCARVPMHDVTPFSLAGRRHKNPAELPPLQLGDFCCRRGESRLDSLVPPQSVLGTVLQLRDAQCGHLRVPVDALASERSKRKW